MGREPEPGEAGAPWVITSAPRSYEEEHRIRVRRYMIIMSFRVPCLVIAAIAYSTFSNPLPAILIVGVSVPLPWIAVLMANDRLPRGKDAPSRWYKPAANRPAIEAGLHPTIDG